MVSVLQKFRLQYQPKYPAVFQTRGAAVRAHEKDVILPAQDSAKIQQLFPHTHGLPLVTFAADDHEKRSAINIGVIFSGGQAPGGHNVLAGLFDGLKSLNRENRLIGFKGGPGGLVDNHHIELTADLIDAYRNTGGFDLIGSGRTKLETPTQFDSVAKNCLAMGIKGLVIVGGDDSNTNACHLAEYYLSQNIPIQVIGCPKTIDGDLKNEWIGASFGFDTACKVYGELIGNIGRDTLSAKKYWHFIKIMGRSASHLALECALQTHPNITIISEEVAHRRLTLKNLIDELCAIIIQRAEKKWNYGVILIPEGLIEFIPEIKTLISELNELLHDNQNLADEIAAAQNEEQLTACGLSAASATASMSLPGIIRSQLVMDRDPHGNVQVSKIETDRLLMHKVNKQLIALADAGKYHGTFAAQNHFFGYEGRCAAPSNFDANYCYSLGMVAAALIAAGKTGYIGAIANLAGPVSEWQPLGVPITSMMNIERRKGANKAVIKKALVDLAGKPFAELAANRNRWAVENDYVSPGPIQYFGPEELTDQPTRTLLLETT